MRRRLDLRLHRTVLRVLDDRLEPFLRHRKLGIRPSQHSQCPGSHRRLVFHARHVLLKNLAESDQRLLILVDDFVLRLRSAEKRLLQLLRLIRPYLHGFFTHMLGLTTSRQ